MFKSLTIERNSKWKETHPGQIVATLKVENPDGESMVVVIPEPSSLKILQSCGDIIAEAAEQRANEFRNKFVQHIAASNSIENQLSP